MRRKRRNTDSGNLKKRNETEDTPMKYLIRLSNLNPEETVKIRCLAG